MEIQLGDRARDRISGFIGIVVGITQYKFNCNTVGIRPEGLFEGKPIECQWFDVPSVIVVSKGEITPQPAQECSIQFLDSVKDKLGEMRGIVCGMTTYISGCIRVGIQPKETKDGGPVDTFWLPCEQVKLVKAAKQEEKRATNGGPMSSPSKGNRSIA